MQSIVTHGIIVVFSYLIIINIVSFHLYRIDKRKAERGEYRIPETVLLGIAFLGGALGAFCAMREYRHKTLHTTFAVGVPIAMAIQIGLVLWVMIRCLLYT